ncbi:MAG: ankyrin repeat domain-containing protein [Phycisphaerales bacterium]
MPNSETLTRRQPLALWLVVIALLVSGAVLMYVIQDLTRNLSQPATLHGAAANRGNAAQPAAPIEALRAALDSGDATGLQKSLERFTDVNAQLNLVDGSRRQMTLLAYAAMQSTPEAVRALLAKGADPDAADAQGVTPLMLAASRGDAASLAALIQAKARVDLRNKWGETALMNAARAGDPAKVRALLAAGASLTPMNEDGHTALGLAAGSDEADAAILQVLLDAGADANHASRDGMTALMRAAESGNYEKCVALLNAGAKAGVKDADGRTARDWAAARGNDASGKNVCADLLAQAGS